MQMLRCNLSRLESLYLSADIAVTTVLYPGLLGLLSPMQNLRHVELVLHIGDEGGARVVTHPSCSMAVLRDDDGTNEILLGRTDVCSFETLVVNGVVLVRDGTATYASSGEGDRWTKADSDRFIRARLEADTVLPRENGNSTFQS